MSNRIVGRAAQDALRIIDRVGATLEQQTRSEIEDLLRLAESVAGLDMSGPSIQQAAFAAIREGHDPFTDEAVQAAMARHYLGDRNGFASLSDTAFEELRQYLLAHTDDIVLSLKPAFDEAGARYREAHNILVSNNIRGLDDRGIMDASLEVAQANVTAREAEAVLEKIRLGVRTFYFQVGGGYPVIPITPAVEIADVGEATAEAVRRVVKGRRSVPFWDLADAGYTFSLATPAETIARAERAQQVQEQAQTALAEAADEARRASLRG